MPQKFAVGLFIALSSVALVACTSTTQDTTANGIDFTEVEATLAGEPVGYTCDTLLPDYVLEVFDEGWTADPSFTPAPGSSAQIAVDIQGIACAHTGSDGQTLVVTLALPTDDSRAALIEELDAHSEQVPDSGWYPTFFTPGQLNAFTQDGFWLSFTDPDYDHVEDFDLATSLVGRMLPAS